MRVVAFLFESLEAWRHFRPEGRILRQLGHEVIVLARQRWEHSEVLSPGREASCDAQLFLSDRASSIPRLTRKEYQALCGDDIDFAGCALWQMLAAELPLSEEFLFLDSAFYQRLHGFAFRIGEFLRALSPEFAIIQHGCHPVFAIFAAKCLKHGVPFLMSESTFFADSVLLDPAGVHFFPGQNRLDRMWPAVRETPLTETQARRLDSFITTWKERRGSKYVQPEDERERALVEEFTRGNGTAKTPVLFIPDQIPTDANVLLGLGRFGSLREFSEYCDRTLPPEWRIILKRHPKRSGDYSAPASQGQRMLVVNDVSIHSLIELCDAVGTFSSTVGFEALLYGKPVVCGGVPFYSRRGFTLDLVRPDRDREALAHLPDWKPDQEAWRRFAHHVIFEYLVRVDDLAGFEGRLREAAVENYSNPRAPFAEAFPRYAKPYLQMVGEYSRLAEQNLTAREILPKLGWLAALRASKTREPALPGRAGALNSGERQVVSSYAEAERKHMARYAFASAVLRRWPAESALDLACGCGYGAHLLAETTSVAVTAVDGSEPAIAFARRAWPHQRVEYCLASAGAFFERPRGPYDAIVCFETIEHVPNDSLLLEKLWGVLKPGGILLLSCPNENTNPLDDHLFHIRHYSADSLRSLLAGLAQASSPAVWGQAGGGAIGNVPAPPFLVAAIEKLRGEPARLPPLVRDLIPFTIHETPQQKHFYFSPDRFSIPGDDTREEEYILSLAKRDGMVVYGPYTVLPEGCYESTFLIELARGCDLGDAALTADVMAAKDGDMRLLASAQIPLCSLEAHRSCSGVRLRFEQSVEGATIEFRISTPRPYPGVRLRFEGVAVERV
jgi:SAM-dependent methyltransferase